MDQAAPTDPTLNVPTTPDPISPTPSEEPSVASWGNKRWLLTAIIAGVIGVILLISLVVVLIMGNTQTGTKPKPNPSASPSATPQATHNPEDDQFFAAKPLTMVYYSFAQTTNSRNIFQSTPDDVENRLLDIGFPDKYDFDTSPNGAWLLRWNNQSLEKAPAATPNKFSHLFSPKDKDTQIRSVIWQADSSEVAVLTTGGNGSTAIQSTIQIIPLLTMQSVNIFQTTANFDYDLVAFPNSTSLYLQENHQGSVRNLAKYNPQTKYTEAQYPKLNQNGLLSTLHFTQDMHHGYTFNEANVTQYVLESMEQSVVYSINRKCPSGREVNNLIKGISVAPSGELLFIHEALEACPQSRSDATPQPTSRSFIYNLNNRETVEQASNLKLDKIERSIWSPNQGIIWINVDSQTAYTLRRQPLTLQAVPNLQRQALTKERVFFIGWLTGAQ